MKLPTEIFGDVLVAHTPEELGQDFASETLQHLTGQPQTRIIIDLDATENIDSEGLEALLDTQDNLRNRAGDLKICTSNSTNRKILEITRLDQILEVHENVIDAVKSFA